MFVDGSIYDEDTDGTGRCFDDGDDDDKDKEDRE